MIFFSLLAVNRTEIYFHYEPEQDKLNTESNRTAGLELSKGHRGQGLHILDNGLGDPPNDILFKAPLTLGPTYEVGTNICQIIETTFHLALVLFEIKINKLALQLIAV